jgi:hypothetical protein
MKEKAKNPVSVEPSLAHSAIMAAIRSGTYHSLTCPGQNISIIL